MIQAEVTKSANMAKKKKQILSKKMAKRPNSILQIAKNDQKLTLIWFSSHLATGHIFQNSATKSLNVAKMAKKSDYQNLP